MSTCSPFSSTAFLRSSPSSTWIGLRPITPGTGPERVSTSTRWPTSTCGSQPPDPTTCRKPLSLDVAHEQRDLVDVADHGQQRVVAASVHAGDGAAHGVGAHVVGELVGGLAPDGGGRLLVAGRAGGGQQALQQGGGAQVATSTVGWRVIWAVRLLATKQCSCAVSNELANARLARVAGDHDARSQRDLGDADWFLVGGHEGGGRVVVLHHVDARLGGEVQEPQHLAGRGGHQQQLLRVEDRRVALALAGGDPDLLLGRGRRGDVRAVVVLPAEAGGARPAHACLVACWWPPAGQSGRWPGS